MRNLTAIPLTLALALATARTQTPVTPAQPAAQDPAAATTTMAPPVVQPIVLNGIGETVLSPRIKDITDVHNVMPHKLVGIGLVTGLANTGSSDRGTRQALLNMIRKLGLNLTIADVVGGTTTLVTVTAALPPFAKEGRELDVSVEVMTDALSLRGGTLQRCELKGVDGESYVVASGRLTVSGFVAKGQNAQVKKNPSATAKLLDGGLVIRGMRSSYYSESGALELRLRNPTPFNASSVAQGVQTALAGTNSRVEAVDAALVRIELPEDERTAQNAMRVLGLIGTVRVPVENPSKVTIDQTSGTILAGEGVLISPCVVGYSELTISIVEDEQIVQPEAFSPGQTARVGSTRVEAVSQSKALKKVGGGATVADLLQNLEALGLEPAQLVSVFVALEQGGFLHAKLEVQ